MEALQIPPALTANQAQSATFSEVIPADQLTIILTTSPIPSAPSAELISNTLTSLPPCFKGVPLIITFDGYKLAKDEKGQLKQGKVPESIIAAYPEYIENVKNLFPNRNSEGEIDEEGVYRSNATGVTFLRLKMRQGFAFSVKTALDYVSTPYVMVLQHDWLFMLPYPPVSTLLSILQTEPEDVKYIVLMAKMSVGYINSNNHLHNLPLVTEKAMELRKDRPLGNEMVPCFHWYDRPHLCSVDIYRKIFSLPVLRQGDFIEDRFGTYYRQVVANSKSVPEAFSEWKKFGAWMYHPKDGKEIAVFHGCGRTNLLGVREEEKIQNYMKENKLNFKRVQKKDQVDEENDYHLGDLENEVNESICEPKQFWRLIVLENPAKMCCSEKTF